MPTVMDLVGLTLDEMVEDGLAKNIDRLAERFVTYVPEAEKVPVEMLKALMRKAIRASVIDG